MIEPSPLSLLSVVTRSGGFIEAEIDQEVVTLNIESGLCHGLNKVGSRIWRLLENPVKVGEICTTLLKEYEVEPAVCQREILELLEELRSEGLIRTADNEAR